MLIDNQRQSHKPEQVHGRDESGLFQTITSKMSITPGTGGPHNIPSLCKIAARCHELASPGISTVFHLPSHLLALGTVSLSSLALLEMCRGFQKYVYY